MRHFRIGDVARKRDEEAEFKPALRVSERAGEAMKNAAEIRAAPVFFVENAQAIPPCVAAMNHDGQARSAGERKLAAKNILLHVARRMIVKIVEADFAPREHARMLRQAPKF